MRDVSKTLVGFSETFPLFLRRRYAGNNKNAAHEFIKRGSG
jgi:hypothetical protein